MFVPNELEKLADIFKKHKSTLYVVGGYVRSQLMGLGTDPDIDLASKTKPHDIIKMLIGTDFKATIMNERAGVVEIVVGNYRFEHATFRTEKYAVSGEHMPAEVEFIDSVDEDAKRRDFSCNAIYYDIYSGQIVDPLGGEVDIKNKILRACVEPRYLFKNDAERILRMIRFACSCGFAVEQKTLDAAKDNVFRLKFLSMARKRKEVGRILLADLKYPSLNLQFAHIQAIEMLKDIGAIKYLFPNLNEALEMNNQMPNGETAEDYLNVLLHFATPNVRLVALLALCGTDGYEKNGKVQKGFSKESADEAEYQLRNLEYSNETIKVATCCIANFEKLSKDKLTLSDARIISITNYNQLDELEDFALAARSAHLLGNVEFSKSYVNIRLAKKQNDNKLFATNINQIKITNEQIREIKDFNAEKCCEIKQKLLVLGAKKGRLLTNKENLKYARKLINQQL